MTLRMIYDIVEKGPGCKVKIQIEVRKVVYICVYKSVMGKHYKNRK